LEIIFQEVSQEGISITRKVAGTGLGLPVSRRLVEIQVDICGLNAPV
jgi:signal transduction histidine kinase